MKEGRITDTGVPTQQELDAINRLTRRSLKEDEVYVFSVVLCDNEIDRDYERFTDSALEEMARLYVGKTGIFDHSMKGKDQVARIFSCQVERPAGQTTSYGTPYVQVKARAYMANTAKNKELMAEIDAGIKKEVSVGCAMGRVTCSVCGADQKKERCEHQKGRIYPRGGETVCHHLLEQPADAYEWSFVAVPAQRKAGVVKAFSVNKKGENQMETEKIVKGLAAGEETTLSGQQAAALARYVEGLEKDARAGREHRDRMMKETARLAGLVQPGMEQKLLFKMLAGLEYHEICELHKTYEQQLDRVLPTPSQFAKAQSEEKPVAGFETFKI